MEKARRISSMAASNGASKRRQKERDPESMNRSKRRRSERFTSRNEEDSSDESLQHRNSLPTSRIPRHASMIGVLVPRKARSACVKKSGTSSGSYSFEVASPSSSTVSVKQKKSVKSRIPKLPKSSEDDLEFEIAEVLSGLKKQPLSSKREEGVNKLTTEGAGKIEKCKESPEISFGLIPETPSIGVEEESKGVLEAPHNKDESNCSTKLDFDLMVQPTMVSSQERVSPLASDSIVNKDFCKGDSSGKSEEKVTVENEMAREEVKQKKVDKREWLNLDLERPSQETRRDSSLRVQNLDWSQPQPAISVTAQQCPILPLPIAVEGWPSGLPPQGYVPQSGKPLDGSYGSSTLVQPRPKRCATHFFIARNIQLHQHFVKTNHLSTPSKSSVDLKGGDFRPAAGNPSLQGSSLSFNSQAQEGRLVNISAPKNKASESGLVASNRQKKPQPAPPSSSIMPAPAFIFPTNHHFQPVMVPSQSPHQTKSSCVGSASVNFSHPSLSASEASSQYYTTLPNNSYSFQLSSNVRGGTPSQGLPFYNGSYYSPQMFQPAQIPQKQTPVQRETKAASCSSSSHRQLQPQVSVNSLSSQANVQKNRQQSHKSEAKAAGDNSDPRGPYGQIMSASGQPQNFSMSYTTFPTGGAPPPNFNILSNGFHIVSAQPVGHQKSHQASDSKIVGGSCSSNTDDPRKIPAMMKGQTLVFDNPSRTLNFVSGTWPPPPAPTTTNGDPSVFTHHLTQRQQQQSGRSKMMTHSQADSVPAPSSQWINPATSSLTSCNSVNLKQFQSPQHIRAHGETHISFAAPSKSQPSQGQQWRSGSSLSSVTGSAPPVKAANSKLNNSRAFPSSPVSTSAHAQDQTENSASQKASPVCGRNVPPIITSCAGHLPELKY